MITGRSMTRRRFVAIAAAATGLPLFPTSVGAVPQWSWEGIALGAAARIQLCHPDRGLARDLIGRCIADLDRLEDSFSLYRDESEISRLNRDGVLVDPSPDFVALMRQALSWSERTGGAFDPTVQPLWSLYADHFAAPGHDPSGPAPGQIAAVLSVIDHRAMDVERERVAFARPGMAVTLNGIAQGYITDRIVQRLRESGIESTLVEMGEIAGVGLRGDGRSWQIEIAGAPNDPQALLALSNKAAATSSGAGTPFDPTGRFHHLFLPGTGACANEWRALTVVAASATAADALSTALYVMPRARARPILAGLAESGSPVEVIAQCADGRLDRW